MPLEPPLDPPDDDPPDEDPPDDDEVDGVPDDPPDDDDDVSGVLFLTVQAKTKVDRAKNETRARIMTGY